MPPREGHAGHSSNVRLLLHTEPVTIDDRDGGLPLPQLPAEVLARIAVELPRRVEKIAACLRTSASLIEQGSTSPDGLRLAESAAYNVREALDAVVSDQQPATGGLRAVVDAWRQYQAEFSHWETEPEVARARFEQVMGTVAAEQDRSSWRDLKLLEYLRRKAGVEPLAGDLDPIAEYSGLLAEANSALHTKYSLADAMSLHERTVSWFVRMFTPPDAQVRALSDLASHPYVGPAQLDQLRRLATNPHHLRLFFSRITDPAWLDALHSAGLIRLPVPGQAWPVTSLLQGLGTTRRDCVADLLEKLFVDSANSSTRTVDKNEQLGIRFELIRMAAHLGAAGYPVAGQVLNAHGSDRSVRAIGLSIARSAEPADPIVTKVAAVVLNAQDREDGGGLAIALLERLEAGLTSDNATERVQMVAAKLRRLAASPYVGWKVPDIAAITVPVDQDQDAVVILAHYFVRLATRARELGVSTTQLLEWASKIAGEIGERVTSQLLAGAEDIPLQVKIDHIKLRIDSPTATGDDRPLIDDILSSNPPSELLQPWANALGHPSPAPDGPLSASNVPRDWARAWRWSIILSASVMTDWQEAIAATTAIRGAPTANALGVRAPSSWLISGTSPHSAEELSALPALQAAAHIASWRPGLQSRQDLVSARLLARELESVVMINLDAWTSDPIAIVTALREPVYVLHYFRALAESAGALVERAPALIEAAALVREARWTPTPIGDDDFDYEPRWDGVDEAIVEFVAAVANANGRLDGDLDRAWDWSLRQTRERPLAQEELADPLGEGDALASAINRPWGRGLEAVLAFAGWEYRNLGQIRAAFEELLDEVVLVPGAVGLEYRAILMSRRQLLEAAAPAWLDTHVDVLFGDGPIGLATFDLTLKWGRPTSWFLRRFQSELLAAARRGAEHAVPWLLIGVLRQEEGYDAQGVIAGLRGNVAALRETAQGIALLVQDSSADAPELLAAVEIWRTLLQADRQKVPRDALEASGRWTFVTGIDEHLWVDLTSQTLQLTSGLIDYPLEVADRCKVIQLPGPNLAMLLLMLGNGEPWERDYIESAALDALRRAADQPVDQNFFRLRTRLIELGRHEALDIDPMFS